jgi:hypothetical protein
MRARQACRPLLHLTWAVSVVGFLAFAARSAADEAPPVAHRIGTEGLLVRRPAPDKDWQVVADKATVPADSLLVGGGGAPLETVNGAVRLTLTGDLNKLSPFPIIETAVKLHPEAKGVDLDFTLDRGRVDVTNLKTKGSATVRMHLLDKTGDFTLAEPGASVSIEVYGRWPKGVHFTKTPKPMEGPALAIAFLVLKGKVFVNASRHAYELQAPPGEAQLVGQGLADVDPMPQFLTKLPEWASSDLNEEGKRVRALLQRFQELAAAKGVAAALDTFAASDDAADRKAAVLFMAALDDLPRLRVTLVNAKHADVWDAGVVALRHWIGRGPGQDMRLYKNMTEVGKVPAREAEIVLDLLHSYGDDEVGRPETYQFLIGLLNSDRPLLRGLAYWHLIRLVPEGKAIGYDLLSTPEARAKAVAEWRVLVPPGELPKKPKPKDK